MFPRLFFLPVCLGQILNNPFCHMTCGDMNVGCITAPCGKGQNCDYNFVMYPLGRNERWAVLKLHNIVRRKFASGNITLDGKPVANVRAMSYDKELEFLAQCVANTCLQDDHFAYCSSRFNHLVMSLMVDLRHDFGTFETFSSAIIQVALGPWFNERFVFRDSAFEGFSLKAAWGYRHFARMVYSDMTHVGCGRAHAGQTGDFFACLYGMNDTMDGKPIGIKGPACSLCGNLPCTQEYLCGVEEPLESDTWTPPFKIPNQFSGGPDPSPLGPLLISAALLSLADHFRSVITPLGLMGL